MPAPFWRATGELMERLPKILLLLPIAAIPAVAAPPFFAAAPRLCITAGPVTYQLSAAAAAPNYRVRIDNRAPRPDLRVAVIDRVETADFAFADDVAADWSACRTAGPLRTIKVVGANDPADLTISPGRAAENADFTVFVHSTRVRQEDAAALFALMHRAQATDRIARFRSKSA